ncbi:MAG: hypothetical protein ACF8OB_04130, partial [Phycisphaeraceae bacterium JB051]
MQIHANTSTGHAANIKAGMKQCQIVKRDQTEIPRSITREIQGPDWYFISIHKQVAQAHEDALKAEFMDKIDAITPERWLRIILHR